MDTRKDFLKKSLVAAAGVSLLDKTSVFASLKDDFTSKRPQGVMN